MTIANSYFWEGVTIGQAGPYTSAQFAEFVDQAIATGYDGVVHFAENELAVLAASPASKVVNVSTGSAIVRGRVGVNSAITPFTIADNTSGDPRIDAVVVRVTYATQTVALAVLQGSPAASPATPALTQSAAVWEVYLASIAVANGFTTITQANITDLRGYTNGLYQYVTVIPASGFVGFGKTPSYRVDIAGSLGVYDAGSRIIIEGTNATLTNRTALQTSTADSATTVTVLPSGTGTSAAIATHNNSTPTNSAQGLFGTNATYSAYIDATKVGSGTQLPFGLLIGGVAKAVMDTSGNLVVGATTALAKLHVSGADSTNLFGVSGATKGVRFIADGTRMNIQGLDNTLSASYQPLVLNASYLGFETSGVEAARIDASQNMGIGATSPLARLHASLSDAVTNTQGNVLTLSKNTSGTPAAGLGVNLNFKAETSTTEDVQQARIATTWTTVTHASRASDMHFLISDFAAERDCLILGANGSAAAIGFLGAGATARETVTGSRAGNAALADLLTKLATKGILTDGTSA